MTTEIKNPSDVWFAAYKGGRYTSAQITLPGSDQVESIDLTKNDLTIKVTPKPFETTWWQYKNSLTGEWHHVYRAKTAYDEAYYRSNSNYRQVEAPKEITK